MALPASGAISMSQIRTEIGATGAISLNDAKVRLLARRTTAGSSVAMSQLHKAAWFINTTDRTGVSIFTLMGSPTVAGNFVFENRAVISAGTGSFALRTGTFPSGSTLRIINTGTIRGRGGSGGNDSPGVGAAGGAALHIDMNCELDNAGGTISGGGGGGGGGRASGTNGGNTFTWRVFGGGGAGVNAGTSGSSNSGTDTSVNTSLTRHGASGTATAGGLGGRIITNAGTTELVGGTGGARGAAGGASTWKKSSTNVLNGTTRAGGAAGKAIELNGRTVTIINAGTRHGATS